jgi:hypothetical protein
MANQSPKGGDTAPVLAAAMRRESKAADGCSPSGLAVKQETSIT